MAARTKGLILVAAIVGITGGLEAQPKRPAARIVSLVPALTEILFSIGAGPQVVGVSSFDNFPSEVAKLPKVGGLLDPNTEQILALRPDAVIVYGSQTEQERQFARAGIRTYSYRHGGLAKVLETMSELGDLTGHEAEARRLVSDLQTRLQDIRSRVAGRPRLRTLLVLERQPRTLQGIYVSGGFGFLHDMLETAGGTNVFADSAREALQPSTEVLLTRAPEVILELRATTPLDFDFDGERRAWAALASMPATARGQIHFLFGQHLVVPGPRLAQGVEALARALHPGAFR